MSKFIDKLKNGTQASPAPLGFRNVPVQEKPKIQLVASLVQANLKNLADYVAGADAGLLQITDLSSGMEALQKLSQAVPDIPWGGWLKNSQWEKFENAKLEADFLVFPAEMPLFQLPEKMGRILEVAASLSDSQLRAIDDLPVGAIVFNDKPNGMLTWRYLMLLQRLDNLLAKPLLAPVPAGVTVNELQTLWGVGVDAVIIEVDAGQPVGKLGELRKAVDKATFPLPRKSKKMEALLPFISKEPLAETEEEEEEEEE